MRIVWKIEKEPLLMQNSWKIIPNILNNDQVLYLCGCSHKEIGKLSMYEEIHACSQCKNEEFLSYRNLCDKEKLLYIDEFKYEFRFTKDPNGWQVTLYGALPALDDAGNYILKEIDIIDLMLSQDLQESTTILNTEIARKKGLYKGYPKDIYTAFYPIIGDALAEYICNLEEIKFSWNEIKNFAKYHKKPSLKIVTFLLAHPNINGLEFYLWHKSPFLDLSKEDLEIHKLLMNVICDSPYKSVKKAIYSTYANAIEEFHEYGYSFDHVVSKLFKDPNYLSRLLLLPKRLKNRFSSSTAKHIHKVLELLIGCFEERRVYNLFMQALRSKDKAELLDDTFTLLLQNDNYSKIEFNFKKSGLHIKRFHDEISEAVNRLNFKHYKYSAISLSMQVLVDDLKFVLPRNSNTLLSWARELRNCLAKYQNDINVAGCQIFGIYKNHQLTYAIEIQNNTITQVKGKYDNCVNDEDMLKIFQWRQRYLFTKISQ